MAKVKRNVANELRYGCSVRRIVKNAAKNDELTKWDVTKVILWIAWFKFLAGIRWLWNVICGAWYFLGDVLPVIIMVILGLVINIIGGALVIVIGTLWVITSPIWMPILIIKAPQSAAEAVTDNDYESIDKPEDLLDVPVKNINNFFSKALALMWAPVYNRLSMNRRSYFIKAGNKPLADYPVDVQIEYYDWMEMHEIVENMSKAAMDGLWKRGKLADREAILNVCTLSLDGAITLFNGDEKEFNLLRHYCNTEDKKVNAEVIEFFINVLVSETASADHKDRAFTLLKICAERGALEVEAQLQLATQFTRATVGEQAEEVLKLYWKKNTFSTAVMEKLIQLSTANGDVSRPFNLLKKAVDRDGIKTSLAELFFDRCDSYQNEEMSCILKERIDREKVSHFEETYTKEWEDYLNFIKDLSVEAQSRLQEWQYDAFIKHGFTLAKEAACYLLVYGIDSYRQDYFKKVLNASASELDETTQKLLMLTEWKREILIKQKGCRLQGWLLRVPLPESTLA